MSADNWTRCPRCTEDSLALHRRLKKEADEAYGNVPVGEFLGMKERAEQEPQIEETFREDYKLGVDQDGTFSVSYSGACSKCGLNFSFSHKCKVPMTGTRKRN